MIVAKFSVMKEVLLSIKRIQDRTVVIAHSSSFLSIQIDKFLLNPGCLASLSTIGSFVRNEVINASLFIFNRDVSTSEYFFDLSFMHALVDQNGYNYDAVNSWTGDTNIFTKKYLHFSVVFNKRHVHFVVHVAERLILTYDFLDVKPTVIASVILRFLCDEFILSHNKEPPLQPLLLNDFSINDWRFENAFSSNFLEIDPVDSGVFLLKIVELLRLPTHDFASLSKDNVPEFRAALTATLLEF